MDITEKETVRLNIGGTVFKCYKKTLNAFPGSKLDKLDEQKEYFDLEQNEFYFDRNPLLFAYILDAFRKGAIHIPKDSCGTTFKKELEFWEIPLCKVAPCCLEALYRSEDDIEKMDSLMNNEKETPGVNVISQEKPSLRKRLWLFLDDPSSSRIAQVWSTIMSFLVLASTFTDALSTVSTFQQNFTDAEIRSLSKVMILFSGDNTTVEFLKTQKPNDILIYITIICHIILTLELVLCFIACENKRSYMVCFTRICTAFGYASFWITCILYINLEYLESWIAIAAYLLFSYLQIIKLARLFYFTERIPAFAIMGLTFRSSIHEFKILAFLLGILVTIFGYFMFAAEYFQNQKMSNIFTAIYWALITVTTVGYGDYTPDSVVGHVIASACAVTGVLVLALPIGIIASNFYKFYSYHGYSKKHVETLRDRPWAELQSSNCSIEH